MHFACGPGCSQCCSVNVTATSLEVEFLLATGKNNGSHDIIRSVVVGGKVGGERYRPTCTINDAAGRYLRGRSPLEDSGNHAPGVCPLLDEDGTCAIYAGRPFACRAMSSLQRCGGRNGEAVLPPFFVSLSFVVSQIIEHLDCHGRTGNFLDLLEAAVCGRSSGRLPDNHPLVEPVFDPAFRKPVNDFLAALLPRPVGGITFGDLLPSRLQPR